MKKTIILLFGICLQMAVFAGAQEISCAEAAKIAAGLAHNTPTTETYTVVGYVTETDGVLSRGQQIFWMADAQNGGRVFQSYWCTVPEVMQVGDKVSVTGKIMRYNSTYEIKNGTVTLLSREEDGGGGSTDDEPVSGEPIVIPDPENWTYAELQKYVGQTIEFATPFYVCGNSSSYSISPRRIYSPTNQEFPLSAEYNSLLTLNAQGTVGLTGVSGYHRLGERLHKLRVKVNSQKSLSLVSCEWRGNTRAEMEKGVDMSAIDMYGEHTLLVCCMNLEYYLVENFGTGYGPDTYEDHQKQRAKVSAALAKINADLYGFIEIEQGQSALAELAADLTSKTGRKFTYINDGGSASSSYTKAGYVYCSDVLAPHGSLRNNNVGVKNRKKTQAFKEKATGEVFLFSVNHFKAKSGSGKGDNADQGDGQGTYNGDRVREAQSLLDYYESDSYFYGDDDILIMGDLNAYAMEDPITVLREGGMIDLHRAFHADSSYSYVYRSQAGYLDHALCNSTLYPYVTGMVAYHINSDESDSYTYDKSSDNTMFRCSDHDPVLVGLRLDSTATPAPGISGQDVSIGFQDWAPYIYNASGGYYIVYGLDGSKVKEHTISTNQEEIKGLNPGIYILNIYGQGKCLQTKIAIQ
jgi:predicted extracellular nuclease